ncbi:hypothetical protein ABFA07_012482 [Porites harrisoni]
MGIFGAKRFNDLYQFADSTKNVSRATANSTCQVPLRVPSAIQAGLLGGGAIFIPRPPFSRYFLSRTKLLHACYHPPGGGTPGTPWWGVPPFSPEILTLFQIKKYHFRPGL